jgi:hypothetical protein
VATARSRYDGLKRNPWDEEECGHHYARAMSSWSTVTALSGFNYEGDRAAVTVKPLLDHDDFQSFWATGTGWGSFSLRRSGVKSSLAIHVLAGTLPCRSCTIRGSGSKATARLGGKAYALRAEHESDRLTLHLSEPATIGEGEMLEIEVSG